MPFPSFQMCGAGLLGWKRRGPGAHYHSREGYVHRHPVQGENTFTATITKKTFSQLQYYGF